MKKLILAIAAFAAITSAASASQAISPAQTGDAATTLGWCEPYRGH